ncbi:MAG TPA: carboxylating nicotinate-nucleotide diphosphorylase [Porphyromonadaceae bacterium]|nr:carboxylating nicotinate-nucleotide diphosphorylase [Porphyromonadaceae bacterium]
MPNTKEELIEELITLAFKEDIGDGDHTTLCSIPENAMGKAHLLIKEEGVIAGIDIAERIFRKFDSSLKMNPIRKDGDWVKPGEDAFFVEGKVRSLLQTERLVLNVMQRMSGVATTTRHYVDALKGTKTRVLDTRKTTPGMRILEKEAVKIGGGYNHRIGLFDMILLKDNHVDFCGGIRNAILSAKKYLREKSMNLKIEIEVRNLQELDEALQTGEIDRIMLDNFSVEQTKEAVQIIKGRYETESSGGITFNTLREYAECGVDYISVGALTHSIKSLDMSLKAM